MKKEVAWCNLPRDFCLCEKPTEYGCRKCGFERNEARRRKQIPLEKDEKTGLARKIIIPKSRASVV